MKRYLMQDLTWRDMEKISAQGGIVLIPVGSTEPHGPHLTLMCDALHAYAVAKRTAEKANKEFPVVVTPMLAFGCSNEHEDFPGYLSIRVPTFITVITELVSCLHRHRFDKIIIINGHGGNSAALAAAVTHIRDELGLIVGICNWTSITRDLMPVDHGGAMETSLILHVHPQGVYPDRYPAAKEMRPSPFVKLHIAMDRLKQINPEGFVGAPKDASAEQGRLLIEKASDVIVTYLREIIRKGKVIGQFI
ncbi:MAG: creatininase family protein [Candidatus Ranarchaeia archaeon]